MAELSFAPAESMALVDHHVHSVLRHIEDRESFESCLTESSEPAPESSSFFDSFLGAAVLSCAAPVLDLPITAGPVEYLSRRIELGGPEANRRLLRAAGLSAMLVDHGFRGDSLVGLGELEELAATPVRRIARLEQVAEEVALSGASAAAFADAFAARLAAELSGPDAAVGCKSVLAYRHGLDIDPAEPSPAEVRAAAEEWLSALKVSGEARLRHPVLLRHLVWAGLRAGVPLQFHTGYGDADLELHRSNPVLLTELIRRSASLGTPIMLLHCYPYHREAAYLAGVYQNVYFDIGLAITYVGHRAPAVLAEALESAPFAKMLYSSDAFGLAELHLLGAVNFRRALSVVLEPIRASEGGSDDELARAAAMIGHGNAERVYGLSPAAAARGSSGGA